MEACRRGRLPQGSRGEAVGASARRARSPASEDGSPIGVVWLAGQPGRGRGSGIRGGIVVGGRGCRRWAVAVLAVIFLRELGKAGLTPEAELCGLHLG